MNPHFPMLNAAAVIAKATVFSTGRRESTPALGPSTITPRQAEVLALLLQGKQDKEIARDLGLEPETIKSHVAKLLRAHRVKTRVELVVETARKQRALLLDALWVSTEHNALHFGESHNTVIQGRAAIAVVTGSAQ